MFWIIIFLWGLAAGASALTIMVDGKLGDWGLDTKNFKKNKNDWDPKKPGVFVWQEDWVKKGGFVDPGSGGQKYDVEAVLATFDAENLYIAIATGFPKRGRRYDSTTWYDAGDIAFDVGADGTWDYALVLYNFTHYFDFAENKFEKRSRNIVAGGFYKVSSWQEVSISSHSISNPFRMKSGTWVGNGTIEYKDDLDHSFPRYFIEAAIPLSFFDEPFTSIKIHWTMECGNDYGEVVAHTPEPASILLAGAGLFAVSMFLRRRRREG